MSNPTNTYTHTHMLEVSLCRHLSPSVSSVSPAAVCSPSSGRVSGPGAGSPAVVVFVVSRFDILVALWGCVACPYVAVVAVCSGSVLALAARVGWTSLHVCSVRRLLKEYTRSAGWIR